MRPWVRMKLNPGSGRGRVPLDPGEAGSRVRAAREEPEPRLVPLHLLLPPSSYRSIVLPPRWERLASPQLSLPAVNPESGARRRKPQKAEKGTQEQNEESQGSTRPVLVLAKEGVKRCLQRLPRDNETRDLLGQGQREAIAVCSALRPRPTQD
ncbi:hypothetical protein QTO34_001292 [Cnephaeus nilssonii]|uniref:Uncharacterized protein n=1 Tax=Cnephaeus nilssonii TaxID=3371016 RepID=A0AA40HVE9_CNENI|nr:hypothetical protein QTO34_001292 [Eptesicus nilssonii]